MVLAEVVGAIGIWVVEGPNLNLFGMSLMVEFLVRG